VLAKAALPEGDAGARRGGRVEIQLRVVRIRVGILRDDASAGVDDQDDEVRGAGVDGDGPAVRDAGREVVFSRTRGGDAGGEGQGDLSGWLIDARAAGPGQQGQGGKQSDEPPCRHISKPGVSASTTSQAVVWTWTTMPPSSLRWIL